MWPKDDNAACASTPPKPIPDSDLVSAAKAVFAPRKECVGVAQNVKESIPLRDAFNSMSEVLGACEKAAEQLGDVLTPALPVHFVAPMYQEIPAVPAQFSPMVEACLSLERRLNRLYAQIRALEEAIEL